MKNTKQCTKCESRDLIKIQLDASYSIASGWFSHAKLTRYVCSSCGFSEEWIEKKEDLEALKKWYKKD
jgi:predicted nucleic-acid-binding Zn-ribbon protein